MQARLGPCLSVGMGEASLVEQMNSWGAARDQEALDLRSNLAATQVVVSTAFDQAKETLYAIVVDFRAEAETMRQHGQYEAAQSVARLELVVAEARARFDAQDGRFTDGLSELVRRQQAVEAWARAEPTRVAAAVRAAPAPPWVPTSPGGTPLTFYPSPGLPAVLSTPPPRALGSQQFPETMGASTTPAFAATLGSQQASPAILMTLNGGSAATPAWTAQARAATPGSQQFPPAGLVPLGTAATPASAMPGSQQFPKTMGTAATPAWDAWAAGRAGQSSTTPPDPWAASAAAPRYFDMGTPVGGGGGGGKGGYPQKEMRIDACL